MCKTPRATALLACLCAATSCVSVDTLSPAAHAAAGRLLAFAPAGLGPHGGLGFLGGGAARWEHDPVARRRPQPWGPRAPGAGPRRRLRRDRCWDAQRFSGGVAMGIPVPMAGFIKGLRKRLRNDAGEQAGGGNFGDNEVGALNIFDVRLDGSKQRRVLWDDKRGRLITASVGSNSGGKESGVIENEFTSAGSVSGGYRVVRSPAQAWELVSGQIKQAFLPRGVTSDYYAFTLWRMAQRIVSSTVSVFGTQSLLLALGVKTNKVGVAAAAGWVWANAIGKFGKTAFAARYGRAFDSDAKRWRLRAALMWVLANGMEILTFVIQGFFSQGFTALVACSVSLKQISILTASATRGTFYKQFAGASVNSVTMCPGDSVSDIRTCRRQERKLGGHHGQGRRAGVESSWGCH